MLTRSQRRAVPGGRDKVRAHPMPLREPSNGFYGRFIHAQVPMRPRPKSDRSGQQRINAKRNQRAEFWRTVTIPVSTEMAPYFSAHLHLLGKGARIHRARPAKAWFGFEMDVHIPGAPAHAVRAEPIYRSVHEGDGRYRPELDSISWYDAEGKQIQAPELATGSR